MRLEDRICRLEAANGGAQTDTRISIPEFLEMFRLACGVPPAAPVLRRKLEDWKAKFFSRMVGTVDPFVFEELGLRSPTPGNTDYSACTIKQGEQAEGLGNGS